MAYRSISTIGYTSGTTAKPGAPSGLAAGDTVINFIYVESLTITATAPSGGSWTVLYSGNLVDAGGSDYRVYVHYIESISASDVTNWTNDSVSQFSFSSSVSHHVACAVWSGRASSPVDSHEIEIDTAYGTWPTGNVTASGSDTDLVVCSMNYSAESPGSPTGYTARYSGGEVDIDTLDAQSSGAKSATPSGEVSAKALVMIALAAPAAGVTYVYKDGHLARRLRM